MCKVHCSGLALDENFMLWEDVGNSPAVFQPACSSKITATPRHASSSIRASPSRRTINHLVHLPSLILTTMCVFLGFLLFPLQALGHQKARRSVVNFWPHPLSLIPHHCLLVPSLLPLCPISFLAITGSRAPAGTAQHHRTPHSALPLTHHCPLSSPLS